jgi:hypothetical protein
MKFPKYRVERDRADLAYEAYQALQLAARTRPTLLDNEYYRALQDTAYARFLAAFEVVE